MEDDTLWMIRENLDDLPSFAPPDGFGIRWYRPGDDAVWVALQAPFYQPGAVTPGLFRAQYGADETELARRLFFFRKFITAILTASF